ncbi:MAG: hypothetical protein ACRDZQ_12990 [Acidimicrobiales bacterium]
MDRACIRNAWAESKCRAELERQTRDARAQARTAQQARARRRRRLEALGRRTRTKPGEDVAAELVRAGAVQRHVEDRQVEVQAPPASQVWSWVTGRPAPSTWRTARVVSYVDWAGRRWPPGDLRAWGPRTRAVLEAALDPPRAALSAGHHLLALPPAR